MNKELSASVLLLFLLLAVPGHHNVIEARTLSPQAIASAQDTEITALREKYLAAADSLCTAKKYREACVSCQKLLDILFKKSVASNFDVWMSAYGNLYRQADIRLRKARTLYEENRRPALREVCARKQKDYMSLASSIPSIRARIPLKVQGSLSPDGALIITSFNTESPPVSSNHIIGVYIAESGEKLYDEMPIPDDRKNPQINRWGRAYVMQNPVWSPDGTTYAYTINGALCVNNDGSVKPALISQIPDNEAVTDRFLAWSPDGRKLAYCRSENSQHTIYWSTVNAEKEHRVMAGSDAVFSGDSTRLAVISPGGLFLYTLATGKTESLGRAEACAFSPDSRRLAIIRRKGKDGQALILRDLNAATEQELASTTAGPVPFTAFSRCSFLSLNLLAFGAVTKRQDRSSCDIWICALPRKTLAPLTRDGASEPASWLSTYRQLATQKELLLLNR